MTPAQSSCLRVAFRLTAVLGMLSVYFLSTTNAAWIIDGNGFREINITRLLETARNSRQGAARAPPVTCSRGDALVRVGTTWRERCRQCTCREGGVMDCDGPTCSIPYDAMQEITCAKWADNCCCSELGCILEDGTTVPVGGAMPFDPARPCHKCTCRGANRTSCVVQTCWPFQCVDMVPKAGQCCPDCPNGRTCVLPFQERRQLSRYQLQFMEPVREFSPVMLREGTADEVKCTCEGNMVAICNPTSPNKDLPRPPPFNIVA